MTKILAFKVDDAYHRLVERKAKEVPDRTISDLLRQTMEAAIPPDGSEPKKPLPHPMPSPN